MELLHLIAKVILEVAMDQLLHFVFTVVVLYWIISDEYVFLDCIGLLLTAADIIYSLYSMAVQDGHVKRVLMSKYSLCRLRARI